MTHDPILQKIAEGREAEIFAWQDGAVLRLLRNPNAQLQVEWEARAMEAAKAAGVSVPAVRGTMTAQGRPGLIMDRVEGSDLLAWINRRPWLVWSLGKLSGRLHAQLNGVVAPETIPSHKERSRQRITGSDLVPPEVAERALAALDALPDGDRLCHGDFHPGNIIRTDGDPVIIDWTGVTRGDPTADFVRTDLMIRMGDLPPGTPIVIRVGAKFARGIMRAAYRRAYLRDQPLDRDLIELWELPVAAVRLTEGIEPERAQLLQILEKAAS